MRERGDCTPEGRGAAAVNGAGVSIFVRDEHPVLRLKQVLDWAAITKERSKHWRAAGKNVDGGPGRPWPVSLDAPLLVLMWVKAYHARQMEEYLSESVVARRFLALADGELAQIRDHARIARAAAALGAEGKAALNALVIQTAAQLQFTQGETLSADTTVQEPAIGYPHEPGILRGWAERIERALQKLKARGVGAAPAGIQQAKAVYRSVKPHQLFAKTTAEKKAVLATIVAQSEALLQLAQGVSAAVSTRGGHAKQRAGATLQHLGEVARTLLPQIKQWMTTGRGATEKILHTGIPAARAISKGAGKVKWGMKWLLNRLPGGYLLGHRVAARADENTMPQEALKAYRQVFGNQATPQMVVYDRGASLSAAAQELKKAGVRKVGIPPREQGAWQVGKKDQRVVKSERGKTAGSSGRLKRTKYGFSHRQERCLETQDAAGPRAIVSVNLNTLLRDVVAQANAARGPRD